MSLENFPLTPAEMGVELRHLPFYGHVFLFNSEIKIFGGGKAVTIKTEDGCESSNCVGRSECCGTHT